MAKKNWILRLFERQLLEIEEGQKVKAIKGVGWIREIFLMN